MANAEYPNERLQELFEHFGEERAQALLQKFVVALENSLQGFEQAWQTGDNETMHRMAHSLKSSFANVGAEHARQQALRIEKELEPHVNDEVSFYRDNHQVVELLQSELEQTKRQLQF